MNVARAVLQLPIPLVGLKLLGVDTIGTENPAFRC